MLAQQPITATVVETISETMRTVYSLGQAALNAVKNQQEFKYTNVHLRALALIIASR